MTVGMEIPKADIYFTYPSEGGERVLGDGVFLVDFEKGTVRGPNIRDSVSNNLRSTDFKFCRSLYIKSSQDMTVSLEGVGASAGQFTVYAGGKFRLNGIMFTKLRLSVTGGTSLNIFTSTNPLASFSLERDFLTDEEVIAGAVGAVAVDILDLQVANNRPPIYSFTFYTDQDIYWCCDAVADATCQILRAGSSISADRRVVTNISALMVGVAAQVDGTAFR